MRQPLRLQVEKIPSNTFRILFMTSRIQTTEFLVWLLWCAPLAEMCWENFSGSFNPLWPGIFFPPIFEIRPMLGLYRLLTYRRSVHRIFFFSELFFLIYNRHFGQTELIRSPYRSYRVITRGVSELRIQIRIRGYPHEFWHPHPHPHPQYFMRMSCGYRK